MDGEATRSRGSGGGGGGDMAGWRNCLQTAPGIRSSRLSPTSTPSLLGAPATPITAFRPAVTACDREQARPRPEHRGLSASFDPHHQHPPDGHLPSATRRRRAEHLQIHQTLVHAWGLDGHACQPLDQPRAPIPPRRVTLTSTHRLATLGICASATSQCAQTLGRPVHRRASQSTLGPG